MAKKTRPFYIRFNWLSIFSKVSGESPISEKSRPPRRDFAFSICAPAEDSFCKTPAKVLNSDGSRLWDEQSLSNSISQSNSRVALGVSIGVFSAPTIPRILSEASLAARILDRYFLKCPEASEQS